MSKVRLTKLNFFKNTRFWNKPSRLSMSGKTVSLMELFFDIIVVVALGGITHEIINIMKHYAYNGEFLTNNFIYVLLYLVSILQLWHAFTTYSSRYELPGMRHRLFTMLLMLMIVLSSIGVWIGSEKMQSGSFDKEKYLKLAMKLSILFIAIANIVFFYINFSAYLFISDKYERFTLRFMWYQHLFVSAVGIVNILLVFLTDNKAATYAIFSLWLSNLIAWLIIDRISYMPRAAANLKGDVNSHIQERCSILFIVFASEMIIQVLSSNIQSYTESEENITTLVGNVVGGFLLTFAFWWVFEYLFNLPNIKEKPSSVFWYAMSMMNVFIALIFISAGMSLTFEGTTIVNDDYYSLNNVAKFTLFAGLAYYYLWQSLTNISTKVYTEGLRYVWPTYFRVIVNMSSIIYAVLSIPVWFKEVDSTIWFWYSLGELYLYVLVFIIVELQLTNALMKDEKIFDSRIQDIKKAEEEWVIKHIVPHADRKYHKKHDYATNMYGKVIRKIDKK